MKSMVKQGAIIVQPNKAGLVDTVRKHALRGTARGLVFRNGLSYEDTEKLRIMHPPKHSLFSIHCSHGVVSAYTNVYACSGGVRRGAFVAVHGLSSAILFLLLNNIAPSEWTILHENFADGVNQL